MARETPYSTARRLERMLSSIITRVDIAALDIGPREIMTQIRRQAGDVKLGVRDYEYAENRKEQISSGQSARESLQVLRANILTASEYGMFGSVDVVQLSAWIDSLTDQLE